MKLKKYKCYLLVCCIVLGLLFGHQSVLAEEMIFVDDYPFEAILSNGNRLENTWTGIFGYPKIEENGIVMYYSMTDYLYDTRENAVWIKEREDYSLKEYIEDRNIKEGEKTGLAIVVDGKGAYGCAMSAVYLDGRKGALFENDPIYKNANKSNTVEREVWYNEKNEMEDVQEVSFYRLMGNPWEFDGKRVKMEAVISSACVLRPNLAYENTQGLRLIEKINGENINALETFQNIVKQMDMSEIESIGEWMAVISAETTPIHIWVTCSFYMYQHGKYEGESYTYVQPSYLAEGIEIHEKSRDAFEDRVQMLETFKHQSGEENK